jgi:hypothetical protein
MAFDDLPLSRPPAPPERRTPPGGSPQARWLIVAAGAVVAGSLLALWWVSRAQAPPVIPAPASAADAAAKPVRPQRQPLQLPPLDESDAMFREIIGGISRHPLLSRLLATREVVRSITLAVVQIGDGKTPADPLAAVRPAERLDIAGGDRGPVVEPAFARWDAAVRALQSVPARDAAQIYVNVKPLFDAAYRELGFPDGDFDQAIAKAIRVAAATPDAPATAVLLRREGYFEHEDAALQSLAPVQKQLILLGPDRRRQVVAWLTQLAGSLELQIAN